MLTNKFTCSHCDKKYKIFSNLEKHMLICKYRNNNEHQLGMPSREELYSIIVTMTNRMDIMEKKIEELKKDNIKKNRKVSVIEWLNQHIQPMDFDKWKSQIKVSYEDFEETVKTTQVSTCVNIVNRHIISCDPRSAYPIKCFTQHKDDIYIYKEPKWQKMEMEDIYKLRGFIETELRNHLNTWQEKNEYRNETDEYSEEFINNISKVSGNYLSYQELGQKFKTKLFHSLKHSFTRVTIELE